MDKLAQATAGGIAGVVATVVIYPTVVVKTRLQAQRKKSKLEAQSNHHYNGPFDCFLKIIKHQGVGGLFRGLSSSLPKAFGTNFIFYFAHAFFKPFFQKKNGFLFNMLHGILAGIVVQLIMTPVDFVNTKVMVDKAGDARFFGIFVETLKKHGVKEFYKGIAPQLLLTLNPGVTNVVRRVLEPSGRSDKASSALQDFLIGAGSKAAASTTTYPLVVSKIHMYTAKTLSRETGIKRLLSTLEEIVETEGVAGLYKGLTSQLGSAVLKEAFLNMTRHEIYRIVHSLLIPVQVSNK